MSEYTDLLDTISELDNRDNSGELLNTLNVIANLMFELYKDRNTGASYSRSFTLGDHRDLVIELKYNVKTN